MTTDFVVSSTSPCILIAFTAPELHEVGRIPVATFTLVTDMRRTRLKMVHLFALLQALSALERALRPTALQPERGGWARSPAPLRHLTDKMSTLLTCRDAEVQSEKRDLARPPCAVGRTT